MVSPGPELASRDESLRPLIIAQRFGPRETSIQGRGVSLVPMLSPPPVCAVCNRYIEEEHAEAGACMAIIRDLVTCVSGYMACGEGVPNETPSIDNGSLSRIHPETGG